MAQILKITNKAKHLSLNTVQSYVLYYTNHRARYAPCSLNVLSCYMLDNALFIYMVCLSLHTGVCQVSSPELRVSICYDPGGNSLCFMFFFFSPSFNRYLQLMGCCMSRMMHLGGNCEENGTARASIRHIRSATNSYYSLKK